MEKLSQKLQGIVNSFIEKNVPEIMEQEFIIAAIHFNINLNVCSKYDLMRIDKKVKELANVKDMKLLTKASVFSYELFRLINRNELSKDETIDVKVFLIGISSIITEYMTYRIDEEALNMSLLNELKQLGL